MEVGGFGFVVTTGGLEGVEGVEEIITGEDGLASVVAEAEAD